MWFVVALLIGGLFLVNRLRRPSEAPPGMVPEGSTPLVPNRDGHIGTAGIPAPQINASNSISSAVFMHRYGSRGVR